MLKWIAPYGLMRIWLLRKYGYRIDEPLFYYRGMKKRLRRMIKFSLPYGLVMAHRRKAISTCVSSRRILVDGSILAQGNGKGSRSGIFTVTTELLRRFVRRGVRFDLYNSHAAGSDHDIADFLKSDKELSDVSMCEILDAEGLAIRYCACLSPAFEIPDIIRESGLPRFTIIYDAIPMLFPDMYHINGPSWSERVAMTLADGDHAFSISKCTTRDFRRFAPRLKEKNITQIPLAASERFYPCCELEQVCSIKEKYGIRPQDRYFLSLSSIEPRKNLRSVIRAFADFARDEESTVLVIAGKCDPSFLDEWKGELDACKLMGDRVILTGYVPDEDLSPLYSGALGFVFLSLYEGFGLPPLEAMQCGTPVVCSNNSSIPEVVGRAAILVDPNDIRGVAVAMKHLAHDPNLCLTLRQKGLNRAREFSWDKTADIILRKMGALCGRDVLDAETRSLPRFYAERRAGLHSGNQNIFSIDPSVGDQEELNRRMAAEVEKRGVGK